MIAAKHYQPALEPITHPSSMALYNNMLGFPTHTQFTLATMPTANGVREAHLWNLARTLELTGYPIPRIEIHDYVASRMPPDWPFSRLQQTVVLVRGQRNIGYITW
jgi:hypothetical protein